MESQVEALNQFPSDELEGKGYNHSFDIYINVVGNGSGKCYYLSHLHSLHLPFASLESSSIWKI